MPDHQSTDAIDTHSLIEQRRQKLATWRHEGKAYPNGFHRDALATDLLAKYQQKTATELEAQPVLVKIAGRMMTRRLMGKASFVHLQDMSGRIQLYVRQDDMGVEAYEAFK